MDEIYKKAEQSDTFDKAVWAEKKKLQREAVFALAAETLDAVKTDSAAFQHYLEVQGRFDRYSVTNAVLVSTQFPEAKELKSRNEWKNGKIYIDRDAQKISILEPKTYTRRDGSPGQSFDVKTVYDVSQTSARFVSRGGEGKSLHALLLALMDASPMPFKAEDKLTERVIFDEEKKLIFLERDQPEEALFVSMAREIAAAIFHLKYALDRDASRFKSCCVVYMLLAHYGAAGEDLPLLEPPAAYAEMESTDLKKELAAMRDVLGEIQRDMYRTLKKEADTK